jgi:hypothetical protein
MSCTAIGCDDHDYRVSPLWCAYQYAQAREDRRVRALERIADREVVVYTETEERPTEQYRRPPAIPRQRQEVKVKWNL